MSSNKETLSATKFAEKVGVSLPRILTAIKKGILSESVRVEKKGSRKHYHIDLEKGLKEWADNTDASRRDAHKSSSSSADDRDDDKKGGMSLTKAKTVREFYNAQKAKMDYEERAGQLIEIKQVKAECFKIVRQVRNSILGVPEKISAELAAMDDPRQISIFIKEHLAFALTEINDLENVPRKKS